jgi:hypothetical protein
MGHNSSDVDLAGQPAPEQSRLFLFEPGWKIGRKSGSEREFCYAMAPGKDYYHRILDGEIYLFNSEERLCFPCAARRGLLSQDPKLLRDPILGLNRAIESLSEGFDVIVREDSSSE